MIRIKYSAVAVAAVAFFGIAGTSGVAVAAPTLSIAVPPPDNGEDHKETIGDSGGSNYNVGFGTTNGPGLPTARTSQQPPTNPPTDTGPNWPNTASFDNDLSYGGLRGISGYHASYLKLSEKAAVTFQYMGSGDASQINLFYADINNDGNISFNSSELLFRSDSASNSTTACAMFGGLVPKCDKVWAGSANPDGAFNQYTFELTPDAKGYVKFAYVTGATPAVTLTNDGTGNTDTTDGNLPGYFLGVDPYLTTTQHDTGPTTAVYAGLTDRPATGDHDFQDLAVRISVVPEPGSLALVGLALAGLGFAKRRKAA